MMIAAVVCRGEFTLRINRSTKFTAPHNERVVEQSSLLQVGQQGSRGLVGIAALPADLARQGKVLVPTHVIELDKPDVSLG